MKYVWSASYIAAVVSANFTAKFLFPMPDWSPIELSVGTFLFGVVFSLRDRVHCHGYRWAWGTVIAAALTNLLLSAAGAIPISIVIASFLAILISEGIDTEIFQRSRLSWLGKVYASNAVSVPVDSILFVTIAFLIPGIMPIETGLKLMLGQTLTKYAIAAVTGLGLLSTVRNARHG